MYHLLQNSKFFTFLCIYIWSVLHFSVLLHQQIRTTLKLTIMTIFKNYTELENKLMNGIINTWGDTGCCNTYLDTACENVELSMKQGRGVVSSLIKKGIVLECLPEYEFELSLTDKGEKLLNVETEW